MKLTFAFALLCLALLPSLSHADALDDRIASKVNHDAQASKAAMNREASKQKRRNTATPADAGGSADMDSPMVGGPDNSRMEKKSARTVEIRRKKPVTKKPVSGGTNSGGHH